MDANTPPTCCPVLELRQYTLHPGKRDQLVELFEREFIESQEALGIWLVGQFRDLDHPDRFVWLRGFTEMATRAQALQEFYGGPVCKAHRETAKETMIDSDNVLLLRPARPRSGFSLGHLARQSRGATENPPGLLLATICHLKEGESGEKIAESYEEMMRSELSEKGASLLACFVTENQINTFPALPVREDANVFVWFSIFADETRDAAQDATVVRSVVWPDKIGDGLRDRLKAEPEILRLRPTPRSRLHG